MGGRIRASMILFPLLLFPFADAFLSTCTTLSFLCTFIFLASPEYQACDDKILEPAHYVYLSDAHFDFKNTTSLYNYYGHDDDFQRIHSYQWCWCVVVTIFLQSFIPKSVRDLGLWSPSLPFTVSCGLVLSLLRGISSNSLPAFQLFTRLTWSMNFELASKLFTLLLLPHNSCSSSLAILAVIWNGFVKLVIAIFPPRHIGMIWIFWNRTFLWCS